MSTIYLQISLSSEAASANLIRAGASDGAENNETDCYNELPDVEKTCVLINSVAENLKQRLREPPLDRQLLFGSQKFVQWYQAHKSNPLLASALHRFGWGFWGLNNIEKVRQLAAWQANHCASHSCRKKKKRS